MRILVTGGAGFIGAHLVEWLAAQGHRVRVLDNLSSGQRELLDTLPVELFVGDIRDTAAVHAAMQGMELAFHLAAMVSVAQSVEQPLDAYQTNVHGTLQMLEAARAAGVRRVVQASTCAVYGNSDKLPISEDDQVMPLSPYAASKLAAEQAGQLYTRLYGLAVVALRFFNVYGPRQDPQSPYAAAIPRFVAALREGRQPTVYGDGLQSRDFVYVGDIVRGLWAAATAPDVAGQVFNVGRGEGCSINDLINTLSQLMGVAVQPQYAPARAGEVRHSRADVGRFAGAGFRARVGLREGLAAVVGADSR